MIGWPEDGVQFDHRISTQGLAYISFVADSVDGALHHDRATDVEARRHVVVHYEIASMVKPGKGVNTIDSLANVLAGMLTDTTNISQAIATRRRAACFSRTCGASLAFEGA
jgi:hypothetical protein